MPPRVKITTDWIIRTAIDIVRESGDGALNARDIALRGGCSTQPIFSNFSCMDELRQAVIVEAENIYRGFVEEEIASGEFPAYKSSGMAYIRFAKEEGELFRLLFMRKRSAEEITNDKSELTEMMVNMIRSATTLDRDNASLLHLEIWAFVHGIAVMIATGYFEPERELISRMLTDAYQGIKKRFEEV